MISNIQVFYFSVLRVIDPAKIIMMSDLLTISCLVEIFDRHRMPGWPWDLGHSAIIAGILEARQGVVLS